MDVDRYRKRFLENLRRNAESPGPFGFRRYKLDRKAIIRLTKDLHHVCGLSKEDAIAECKKLIDEFNGANAGC